MNDCKYGEYAPDNKHCKLCFTIRCKPWSKYNSKYKEMETKEVKIECPEGFEIDRENSTLEKIVFKKKKRVLPKTWKEFYSSVVEKDIINKRADWYNINGYLHCLSERYFKSLISLAQLLELRDYYNDGWKQEPFSKLENTEYIFAIKRGCDNKPSKCNGKGFLGILCFKDKNIRDVFYDNFYDIIKDAIELI